MFSSIGTLYYFDNPLKLIVQIDQGIADFYRSLIPKYVRINRPMYQPHISVVRKVIPPNMQFWNKYEGKIAKFQYYSHIYNDETYYWLNVHSKQLENIRLELGLELHDNITRSPDGRHNFHTTLGNTKKLQ